MKKVINEPKDVVNEMLEGLAIVQANVVLISDLKVVVRADIDRVKDKQVSIISGGGSGHEPSHAGFVGDGMLSAAVCGDVFSSPTWAQVYEAIKITAGEKGVLLIIKNYTGDILHFKTAADYARKDGIKTEVVIVNDDVSLLDSIPKERARGIAGTVLLHKSVGALAKEGKSLTEIADFARKIASGIKSMGVALSACTIPSVGSPSFNLGNREIGFGLGIHGESGKEIQSLDQYNANKMVDSILDNILKHIDKKDNHLIVLINNLGSTTNMELYIVAKRVYDTLRRLSYVVSSIDFGTFMTALEMAGFSISVLPASIDERIVDLLNADTPVSAWNKGNIPNPHIKTSIEKTQDNKSRDSVVENSLVRTTIQIIKSVCNSLIDSKDELTRLDASIGDGDIGINLERACKDVLKSIDVSPCGSINYLFNHLTYCLRYYGGTSGALFSIFFSRFADVFNESNQSSLDTWSDAMEKGIEAIMELGGSKEGMKTMLDALIPAHRYFKQHLSSQQQVNLLLDGIAKEAEKGALETKNMVSAAGRSQYYGDKSKGIQDPGATAVSIMFRTISNHFNNNTN